MVGSAISIVLGVLSVIGIAIGGYLTFRSNTRTAEIEAESAPYTELAARVAKLERQVSVLLHEQWVDRAYLQRMLADWPRDRPLPEPRPAWVVSMMTPTQTGSPGFPDPTEET